MYPNLKRTCRAFDFLINLYCFVTFSSPFVPYDVFKVAYYSFSET